MKPLIVILSFFICCLFVSITNLQAQADSRANEIAKQLKITDSQISGRIKQTCEEYYKKLDEAEKQADETQRSIKKLRANQNYAAKLHTLFKSENSLLPFVCTRDGASTLL